ncbi:MAG: 4-hydroxy-tetrahydrodipicolinate reductase [Xanthomonadales bacterium]|nr:4-hydroxy-tetrahydrodipicolinate reductase [Xanthomonadales bacterium]
MATGVALILHGAGGRMGQAVLRIAAEGAGLRIVAAIVRPGSAREGHRVGSAAAAADSTYLAAVPADLAADVVIDFAGAQAFDAALALARERGIAFVSGSTGLDPRQLRELDAAAARIPVLWAANFSFGVAVLAHLVERAATLLPDWDCEIFEAHHRHKRDAPSGTALMLGRAVASARGRDEDAASTDRSGERRPGTTGYAVVRAGDIVGEHAVWFAGASERIELAHRAGDRDLFARGALVAAEWLARRAAGRYTISDVLGIG